MNIINSDTSDITDKTISYYEKNANTFTSSTLNVDFSGVQNKFAELFPLGSYILDFGCGSGRDSKFFVDKGFKVDAVDGSSELCKIAEKTAGIPVKNMLFSDLDVVEKYDGIWACSSILHLPKEELKDVIHKMFRAVKDGGYIYTSFKYGEFEGFRNERFFTDFTESTFRDFIKDISNIEIIDEWVTSDVRPGRGDEKWLNLFLQKK